MSDKACQERGLTNNGDNNDEDGWNDVRHDGGLSLGLGVLRLNLEC